MTGNIRRFSLRSLLAYITDVQGVSPQELAERDVNIKSKADVADCIECYGWAAECEEYCN